MDVPTKAIFLVTSLLGTSVLASGCVVGDVKPDFNYAEVKIQTQYENICWRMMIDGDSKVDCGDKTYAFNSNMGHFEATVFKRSGYGRLSASIYVDDEFVDRGSTQEVTQSFTIGSKP
jgi:hypothetical protein